MMTTTNPICPYCGEPATLFKSSRQFYHGRNFGPVWACTDCDAWVGCHRGSPNFVPLGRLANAELRKAKMAAHAAFDRLWRGKAEKEGCSRSKARGAGYRWLAVQLGVDPKDCHIGMFDVEQCQRVVAVCKPYHGRG